jgi:hypothetical protein
VCAGRVVVVDGGVLTARANACLRCRAALSLRIAKLSRTARRGSIGSGRYSRWVAWDVETKSIVDSALSTPGDHLRALLIRNQKGSSWYGPKEGVSFSLEGLLLPGKLLPGDSGPLPS